MRQPFDTQKFIAQLQATRDLRAPADKAQQHVVTLPEPTTEVEQFQRWDEPQEWCFHNVHHAQGDRWSRRRDRNGDFVFSFSSEPTAVFFAMRFKGL